MTRDGARRRPGRLTPVPVLVMVALLSGCSEPDIPQIKNNLPSPDASSSVDSSSPPVKGKWTGLSAKCPKLEGAAARTLGMTGEGRPTRHYLANETLFSADCQWGPDDGSAIAVNAKVSIYKVQRGADVHWRGLRPKQPELLTGVGDEAHIMLVSPDVKVYARSSNAVAVVSITLPTASSFGDEADRRLKKLQPAAAEITKDVLDDLR